MQEGGQGQETDPSSPDLPSVMLTDHWVATHIIASVSDQPNGRRYSVFSVSQIALVVHLLNHVHIGHEHQSWKLHLD